MSSITISRTPDWSSSSPTFPLISLLLLVEYLRRFLLGFCSYCVWIWKRGGSHRPSQWPCKEHWVTALPFPHPPLCHRGRCVTGSRPEEWPQLSPEAFIHGAEIENTLDLDRLLFSLLLLAIPVGCWSDPTMDQCRGTGYSKYLPGFLQDVFHVADPGITCSLAGGKPILSQQVHFGCTYLCQMQTVLPAQDRNLHFPPQWEMFQGLICTWADLCHPQTT